MSEAQKLVACPLCGVDEGYRLSEGSTYRWWSVTCAGCGQEVSEARATYPAEQTPRTLAADEAWNRAGTHAQSLRDRIAAIEAQQAQDKLDAERWREMLMRVGATSWFNGGHMFMVNLQAPPNVMQGSVAQHFTAAIDAARKAKS